MIQKSVLLACGLERAFALFTDGISDWWPPERRHTGDPASVIVLAETGRFYERARDGAEVELGAVVLWDAPRRLILDWYPGTDREHPTRVEVSFVLEGALTRVLIEHRASAASESLFPTRAPRYEASWVLVLAALARAAA